MTLFHEIDDYLVWCAQGTVTCQLHVSDPLVWCAQGSHEAPRERAPYLQQKRLYHP